LELSVGVLVAVLIVQTWLAMGLVVPVTVSGSSMAPTLRGPHRAFRCPACRTNFDVGLDEEPSDPRAVCPACGSRRAVALDDEELGGDRLIVNRAAFVWRQPQRWDVVVFRCPQQADQLCVKRVVGLPGERVSLAHGDVLVSGQLVRKTLAEQRALRQLVYRATVRGELSSLEEAAWEADLAPLSDAMLTARVRLADDGQLRMVIDGKIGRFEMSYDDDDGQFQVLQDGRRLSEATLPASAIPPNGFCEWTFSLFDGQALVAVDDRIVFVAPFEAGKGPESPSFPAQPRRSAAAIYGLRGIISEPTVWRDAYYEYRYGDQPASASTASASGPPGVAAWQLGPQEYFVLGDNAEISDDSRSWLAGPGLDAKLLFGKPLGVR
jgi:signal peptidase I